MTYAQVYRHIQGLNSAKKVAQKNRKRKRANMAGTESTVAQYRIPEAVRDGIAASVEEQGLSKGENPTRLRTAVSASPESSSSTASTIRLIKEAARAPNVGAMTPGAPKLKLVSSLAFQTSHSERSRTVRDLQS